jgi:hypothetical protein
VPLGGGTPWCLISAEALLGLGSSRRGHSLAWHLQVLWYTWHVVLGYSFPARRFGESVLCSVTLSLIAMCSLSPLVLACCAGAFTLVHMQVPEATQRPTRYQGLPAPQHVCVCVCVCLCVCLFVCFVLVCCVLCCFCLFVLGCSCLLACLLVRSFVRLFVRLFVCLCVCLCVCLFCFCLFVLGCLRAGQEW